jgi:hypothetical protein
LIEDQTSITIDILDGNNSVSAMSFNQSAATFTSTSEIYPFITPTYTGSDSVWLNINQSNVTLSNLFLYHTYNYSSWVGDLSTSSPLILVSVQSFVVINNVTVTSGDQQSIYVNSFIVGMNSGGSIKMEYSTFVNVSLYRVSLVHDYDPTPFYFANVTFKYDIICFFCIGL